MSHRSRPPFPTNLKLDIIYVQTLAVSNENELKNIFMDEIIEELIVSGIKYL